MFCKALQVWNYLFYCPSMQSLVHCERVKILEKHFEEENVERRSVKILGSLKPEQ